MSGYRDKAGKPLAVGPRLGKGGEGEVRLLSGEPNLVVKLYTDGNSTQRLEKIEAMVAAGFHKHTTSAAFPVDCVFGRDGGFAGFTMAKVAGFKPIHELYAPGSRKLEFPKANFPFLLRTGVNIARTIAKVHALGCVIGDINHSGIMVKADATIKLIDCDSFQFSTKDKTYRCRVGVGEYTPPELQGQKLETLDRTSNHDAFGVAVVVFQLLFMGRHPFAGRFKGREDMPIERAIREGRFVYGARARSLHMEPPPGVPTLQDFPPKVAAAFENAFADGHPKRPTAAAWADLLSGFEKELVACRRTGNHHHYRGASACPWCRLESESNIRLFPLSLAKAAAPLSLGLDVNRIISALDTVAPPPLADALNAVRKPEGLTASYAALRIRRYTAYLLYTLAVGAIAATVCGMLALWWATAGLVLALMCATLGFKPWFNLYRRKREAGRAWQAAAQTWQDERGPPRFEERRAALKRLAEDYRHLPHVEQHSLAALESHKRETQLRAFLQTFTILTADIEKIGEGRKSTLASYGIETAGDVTEQALRQVPGFSSQLASTLLAWRKTCESRFVFDPHRPVSRDAIHEVKDDLVRMRLDLEHVLRHGRAELETLAHSCAAAQSKSTPELDAAYFQHKQATCDFSWQPPT
jgi:DNA-binding helix-hairpin-helix protein with protein kinase domain